MNPTQNPTLTGRSIARTLRDTALYLTRHGWCQGAYYDATGGSFTPPACLVGALGIVCYGGPVDAPALNDADPGFADFDEAVTFLGRFLGVRHRSDVYSFNDAHGRTKDDVLRALELAAKLAEQPAPECCGVPLVEAANSPSRDFVDEIVRSYWCERCGFWTHVEVTDPDEKARLTEVFRSGGKPESAAFLGGAA